MIIHDLLDMVSKEKIKRKRAKAAKEIFATIGILVVIVSGVIFAIISREETATRMKKKAESMADAIKDSIHNKADTVKTGANQAKKEVDRVIKDVDGKIKSVKEDIKDGSQDVKQDIHETVKSIAKELKRK